MLPARSQWYPLRLLQVMRNLPGGKQITLNSLALLAIISVVPPEPVSMEG
jgi:hypothetical protein